MKSTILYKGKKYTYKELCKLRKQTMQDLTDVDSKLKEIDSHTLMDTGDFYQPIKGVKTEINKGGGEVITGVK